MKQNEKMYMNDVRAKIIKVVILEVVIGIPLFQISEALAKRHEEAGMHGASE